MKKLFLLPLVAVWAFVALTTSSCVKEEYNLDDLDENGICIQTSVAAPLAKFHSTIGDIFNMEAVSGNVVKLDGTSINLKDVGADEVASLFPLPIDVENTKFGATNYIDDIDFDDVFGSGNAVSSLDSLVLIVDIKSTMPFDINLALGFTADPDPKEDSPEINPGKLHKDATVNACEDGKTVVEQTVYFRYGDIVNDIKNASALKVFLGFEVPFQKLAEVTLSQDQYIDVKLKAYVQGNFDVSDF